MPLSFTQFLVACPLIFLAGFVDAIAGGGGLISLPAYMLAGLPIHNAIGTNKLSSCMGTALTTANFARKKLINWKLALSCACASIIGAKIGSKLSLTFSETVLEKIMLVILPLTALYVLFGKKITDGHNKPIQSTTFFVSLLIALTIGAYDGFYGPGTGTFLIILLTSITGLSLFQANGVAKIMNLASNITALSTFILHHEVIYLLGLTCGVFGMLGNWLGSTMFIHGAAKWTRPIILVVVALFMIKILYKMYM